MAVVRRIWCVVRWCLVLVGLAALVIGGMLAVPLAQPPAMASIEAGGRALDRTGLPGLTPFQARDGTWLAYRRYPAADGGTARVAIVIHGSAGDSIGVNALAKQLAAENIAVIAPDIRGHGASGTRGDVRHLGQVEEDLADLVAELRRQYPQAQVALLGFSLGGGFALRAASGPLAHAFDRLVMISPFLGPDAASTRRQSASVHWANVDMPRVLALITLRRLGLVCCEDMPVVAYAVPSEARKFVTADYSFRLFASFLPPRDLDAAIHRLDLPTSIVAGDADELMDAARYAEVFGHAPRAIDVKIVPGLNHMDMLRAPAALAAIAATVKEERHADRR